MHYLKDSTWFHYSYFYDWITLFILSLISLFIFIDIFDISQKMSDSELQAYENTPIYNLPPKDTIFSMTLTFFLCWIPITIVFLFVFFKNKFDFHDLHSAILGLLSAISIQYLIQAPLAKLTSFPRPNWGYSKQDTASSFPSGHSSVSFCGMYYLSLYIHGKLRTYENNKIGNNRLYMILLGYSPLIISFSVGIGRILSHNHHPLDVFVGAILGITTSNIFYYTHFPYLMDYHCHKAKNRKTIIVGVI